MKSNICFPWQNTASKFVSAGDTLITSSAETLQAGHYCTQPTGMFCSSAISWEFRGKMYPVGSESFPGAT